MSRSQKKPGSWKKADTDVHEIQKTMLMLAMGFMLFVQAYQPIKAEPIVFIPAQAEVDSLEVLVSPFKEPDEILHEVDQEMPDLIIDDPSPRAAQLSRPASPYDQDSSGHKRTFVAPELGYVQPT